IMVSPIHIVRELGIPASLGVAWMIVTNKMLLPILLSHLTMSKSALQKEAYQEGKVELFWRKAGHGVERGRATMIIAISAASLALGLWQAHNLKVGDY